MVLTQVANITNDRPIGIHHLTEDELVPLTVNQLLLGRNSTQKPCYNDEGDLTTLSGAREFHQQLITAWWNMWKEQSFPYLLPFYSRADAKKHDNLEIGDVCQLKYADKVSRHYRLCIVVKTLLSKDGVVRTVIIALNNHRAKGTQVLAKDEMEVGAQRLCLILPVSEQNTEERARVDQWIDARSAA